MTLPDFTDAGDLPPGVHHASVDEIRQRFVTDVGDSAARRDIFERWLQHRRALLELVEVPAQWLCGSFVTDKHDPNDLDVVTILDGPAFDDLPPHRRLVVEMLVRGNYTERLWRVDAWPTFRYPADHPGREIATAATAWLAGHFGSDRDGNERGLVEVTSESDR